MDSFINACLYDILNAIHEINIFLDDGSVNFTSYQNGIKTEEQ
ncbi:MAG: hypothetical protein RL115_1166 [Bacteroidota bacterium]|jgi:hypothetical protein